MKILFRNRAINIFLIHLYYMLKKICTLNPWNHNHIITIMKTGWKMREIFTNFTTETYLKLNYVLTNTTKKKSRLFVNSQDYLHLFCLWIFFITRATLNLIYFQKTPHEMRILLQCSTINFNFNLIKTDLFESLLYLKKLSFDAIELKQIQKVLQEIKYMN